MNLLLAQIDEIKSWCRHSRFLVLGVLKRLGVDYDGGFPPGPPQALSGKAGW